MSNSGDIVGIRVYKLSRYNDKFKTQESKLLQDLIKNLDGEEGNLHSKSYRFSTRRICLVRRNDVTHMFVEKKIGGVWRKHYDISPIRVNTE